MPEPTASKADATLPADLRRAPGASALRRPWLFALTCLAAGAALALLSRADYIAFHLVAEVAVVAVLLTMFTLAWYTRRLSTSGYLTLLGVAALPIAALTLLHALTYRGMPSARGLTADVPTQLWLAARYLTAAALLAATAFLGRRLERPLLALAVLSFAAAALAAAIAAGVFPAAFVAGEGLTPFKVASEYVIVAAFAVALVLLYFRRGLLAPSVRRLLAAALAISIVAELLFTTYTDVYGITNLIGHLAYLLSFLLFYLALVVVVLERPYEALFRELSDSEAHLKEAQRFSDGLNRINEAIHATLDPDAIFQRVVGLSGEVIGADAVVLGLYEGDRFRPRYFYGYTGREFVGLRLDRDVWRHVFQAAEAGGPLAVADAAHDDRVSPDLVAATGVRAVLAVAVVVQGDLIGGLGFHWLRGPHQATDLEKDFVGKVAAALGLALQNARSYANEHDVAEALQAGMEVTAESVLGVDVGRLYVPAPGLGRIGGDFFDVFSLEDGSLAFVLGDVAGRGLKAAAVNFTARSVFRALAYVDPDPCVVLERASTSLGHQLHDGQFVTAAFGVLDTTSGAVRLGLAGHPDPLVAGRPDLSPPPEARRPALGIECGDFPFTCWRFTLAPGETLVLYTDGVIEARNGDELFDDERLRSAVDEDDGGGWDAQTVVDRVLAGVLDFTGGGLADDVAVLALGYVGVRSAPAPARRRPGAGDRPTSPPLARPAYGETKK